MAESSGKSTQSRGDKTESSTGGQLEYGENIDQATFEQILEMDEDDPDQEFSKSLVFGFFDQAENTFVSMDQGLEKKDLTQLSQLGHFLKGSSATLGLNKIKDSCEKIQQFGMHKDETGTKEEKDDQICLDRIKKTLSELRKDYAEVKKMLNDYFKMHEEK